MTNLQREKLSLKLRLKELFWLKDYEPIEMFLSFVTLCWGVWILSEVKSYHWIISHVPANPTFIVTLFGAFAIILGIARIVSVLMLNTRIRRRLTAYSTAFWICLTVLTIIFSAKLTLALFILFATADLIIYARSGK